MSSKLQPENNPDIRDERITDGDHNGKGIANDSYSKSESSKPKLNPPYDVRSAGNDKPKDINDQSSSGKPSTHKGDAEKHSKSAQKSKL